MADATIKASIAAGMAQLITATGGTVNFNGNSYTVARNTSSAEKQSDSLGEYESYYETMTFLNSDLTANGDTLAIGDSITASDGDYQITRIREDKTYDAITRVDVGYLY